MINGLIIAVLVITTMLVTLGVLGLVTHTIIDFRLGEYFKGITNVLIVLLTIFYLVLVWIGMLHRLY